MLTWRAPTLMALRVGPVECRQSVCDDRRRSYKWRQSVCVCFAYSAPICRLSGLKKDVIMLFRKKKKTGKTECAWLVFFLSIVIVYLECIFFSFFLWEDRERESQFNDYTMVFSVQHATRLSFACAVCLGIPCRLECIPVVLCGCIYMPGKRLARKWWWEFYGWGVNRAGALVFILRFSFKDDNGRGTTAARVRPDFSAPEARICILRRISLRSLIANIGPNTVIGAINIFVAGSLAPFDARARWIGFYDTFIANF